jgi:hypothetical protein
MTGRSLTSWEAWDKKTNLSNYARRNDGHKKWICAEENDFRQLDDVVAKPHQSLRSWWGLATTHIMT